MFALFKLHHRLVFHYAELAHAVIDMYLSVPYCQHGHEPLIVIAAVALIDNPAMVGLDYAEVLKAGTPGDHMGLVALRQPHAHPQGDKLEFAFLKAYIFCAAQVYPVRLTLYIAEFLYLVAEIFYLYLRHDHSL